MPPLYQPENLRRRLPGHLSRRRRGNKTPRSAARPTSRRFHRQGPELCAPRSPWVSLCREDGQILTKGRTTCKMRTAPDHLLLASSGPYPRAVSWRFLATSVPGPPKRLKSWKVGELER